MKTLLGCVINLSLILFLTVIYIAYFNFSSFADVNGTKAEKSLVPFDECKPEKGVKFKGARNTKLSTQEIDNLLAGNTLLSVDRFGTFAIYYLSNKETIGWMPKKKNDWSRGSVSFENDRCCRQ